MRDGDVSGVYWYLWRSLIRGCWSRFAVQITRRRFFLGLIGVAAFFESGYLLRKFVLGDREVLGAKAGNVFSLVIGDGHVELDQDNVYAELHRVILSGRQ